MCAVCMKLLYRLAHALYSWMAELLQESMLCSTVLQLGRFLHVRWGKAKHTCVYVVPIYATLAERSQRAGFT